MSRLIKQPVRIIELIHIVMMRCMIRIKEARVWILPVGIIIIHDDAVWKNRFRRQFYAAIKNDT